MESVLRTRQADTYAPLVFPTSPAWKRRFLPMLKRQGSPRQRTDDDLQAFVAHHPYGGDGIPNRLQPIQPESPRPLRNFIPGHYFNALARAGYSEAEILLRWLKMFAPDVLAAIEEETNQSVMVKNTGLDETCSTEGIRYANSH